MQESGDNVRPKFMNTNEFIQAYEYKSTQDSLSQAE